MSIEKVREYLSRYGKSEDIIILEQSSATVELAARALGVEAGRIAKTLTFASGNGVIMLVTAGDVKTDNKKFKTVFGLKAKMLTPDEVINSTGHAVGGVCPFGIENDNVKIYLDESLKRFETVYPACGSGNSAIELSIDELEKISGAISYVDVCKLINET